MSEYATKRYDPISHITWLEFSGKPEDAMRTALKSTGWRWSGYRKQWYNNRRNPEIPTGIEITDDGECDYASERPERLQESAAKHAAKATQHLERSDKMASIIPFGQPILVGHYSEKADRNYRAKIHHQMDKFVEESRIAENLEYKAKSSAAHQRIKENPNLIARRIARMRAEHRPQGEIDAEQAKLDALGGIPADQMAIQKGDIIVYRGWLVLVKRVNKLSITGDYLAFRNEAECFWKNQKCEKTFISHKLTPEEVAQIDMSKFK